VLTPGSYKFIFLMVNHCAKTSAGPQQVCGVNRGVSDTGTHMSYGPHGENLKAGGERNQAVWLCSVMDVAGTTSFIDLQAGTSPLKRLETPRIQDAAIGAGHGGCGLDSRN
jgi:hypothetical protein